MTSLLNLTVFQIPRYIITLHELLAHTPYEHVERKSLDFAKSKLEELSKYAQLYFCMIAKLLIRISSVIYFKLAWKHTLVLTHKSSRQWIILRFVFKKLEINIQNVSLQLE